MKVGVLLAGTVSPILPLREFVVKRNWRNSADNIRKNVIECWEGTVETYLSIDCVEDPTLISSILDYYKPEAVAIQSTHDDGSHIKSKQTRRMVHKYIAGLSLMLHRDLDFVVTTRPDILFTQSLSSLNIDFSKFNFLFREAGWWLEDNTIKHDTPPLVCDNLFAFRYEYLPKFIEAIHEMQEKEIEFYMHNAYTYVRDIVGDANIHFITDTQYCSIGCEFYELDRTLE
jgi:hypothetical protein